MGISSSGGGGSASSTAPREALSNLSRQLGSLFRGGSGELPPSPSLASGEPDIPREDLVLLSMKLSKRLKAVEARAAELQRMHRCGGGGGRGERACDGSLLSQWQQPGLVGGGQATKSAPSVVCMMHACMAGSLREVLEQRDELVAFVTIEVLRKDVPADGLHMTLDRIKREVREREARGGMMRLCVQAMRRRRRRREHAWREGGDVGWLVLWQWADEEEQRALQLGAIQSRHVEVVAAKDQELRMQRDMLAAIRGDLLGNSNSRQQLEGQPQDADDGGEGRKGRGGRGGLG